MTAKKRPEDRLPRGRPRIEFKPEYCQRLIEHMKAGGSLESFGAIPGVSCDTLYRWLEEYPDFCGARKEGMALLHTFYENLGKTISAGQLRRVKSEEPLLDKKGKPMVGPDGQVLMKREYESVSAGQSVFIFMTKNLLGWRDRKDIELSGKNGGPLNFSNLTDDELDNKIQELVKLAKKK